MDANLAALLTAVLTAVVTSATTIILAIINWKKSAVIEKKVDAGNAVTNSVHTIANGRTDALLKLVEEKNKEIQRLSLLVPPPAEKPE